MEKQTETYVQIINDVLMNQNPFVAPVEVQENSSIITIGGTLKDVGWSIVTLVTIHPNSISLVVQMSGTAAGRFGYMTDILNQFVNEANIRAYAEHAYAQLLERNGIVEVIKF